MTQVKSKYFQGKNVLIISPESWNHLFVSKHHYAIELSQNNNVFFLNPPSSKYAVRNTRYANLKEVDCTSFIPALRYFPGFLQRMFMKHKYRKLESLLNVTFDCIWSFDNSVFFDFSFLPKRVLKISHIVDLAQNFQLSKAASTANFCMAVSNPILEQLKKYNQKSYLLGHGISIGKDTIEKIELPGDNKIKALFAGNLDRKHFDKHLLLRLAEEQPEVDFIFCGSGGKDWPRKSNTFYLGVIDSDKLINYLNKADILLLPYKFNEYHNELTNSHKVLDYLRSGKVIVSSFLEDYQEKEHLLVMAQSADEFSQLFTLVLSRIDHYNTPEKIATRRRYAADNTYQKRLEEIESIIDKLNINTTDN